MQNKRRASGKSFAIGISILVLLWALPYAFTQGMEPDVSTALLKETRQLRVEMAGLQTEISKLRAEGEAQAAETSIQQEKVTIEFTEVAPSGAGSASQGNIACLLYTSPSPRDS